METTVFNVSRLYIYRVFLNITRSPLNRVNLIGLPDPAQIIGLVQRQSKRNLSGDNGLQRISTLHISSFSQHNSVIRKSSYLGWAESPSPAIWTGPDTVQEESS